MPGDSKGYHQSVDESSLPLLNAVKVQMRKKIADATDVMCVHYKNIHRLTKAIKTLGNEVERDLNNEDKENPAIQELSQCCLSLRKRFLSSFVFEKCFIYHNNSGLSRPVAQKHHFAVVFAWSEANLQKLYVLPAVACDFTEFDPSSWYFLVFSEGKDSATTFEERSSPPEDSNPPHPPSAPDELRKKKIRRKMIHQ